MAVLHFHIGAEKCASSLIEFVFLQVEGVIQHLQSRGLHTGFDFHFDLRHCQNFESWIPEIHEPIRDKHLRPHLENDPGRIFASEEALLGISHEKGRDNSTALRAAFLAELGSGFDIFPIIVLRRQDAFIESLYNQLVKRGEQRDFEPWFEDLPLENYEWDRIVDVIADRFGADKVTVLPYESHLYGSRDTGPHNLLHAITTAIGVPEMNIDMASFPIVNPSLPIDLLPAQREINAALDPVAAAQAADILARNKPKTPNKKLGLIDDVTRAQLVDRYKSSNRRLFEKYMPDFPSDAYLD